MNARPDETHVLQRDCVIEDALLCVWFVSDAFLHGERIIRVPREEIKTDFDAMKRGCCEFVKDTTVFPGGRGLAVDMFRLFFGSCNGTFDCDEARTKVVKAVPQVFVCDGFRVAKCDGAIIDVCWKPT